MGCQKICCLTAFPLNLSTIFLRRSQRILITIRTHCCSYSLDFPLWTLSRRAIRPFRFCQPRQSSSFSRAPCHPRSGHCQTSRLWSTMTMTFPLQAGAQKNSLSIKKEDFHPNSPERKRRSDPLCASSPKRPRRDRSPTSARRRLYDLTGHDSHDRPSASQTSPLAT